MAQTILIVEDEKDLADSMSFALERDGFKTIKVASGEQALQAVNSRPKPDLILLDRMLPGMNGGTVCTKIRQERRTRSIPIIMVTAKAQEEERIEGFAYGADDYVVKPFSIRELIWRIRALLRRVDSADCWEIIEFGPLIVDQNGPRVTVDGNLIELSSLEYKLLALLLNRRGRVQERQVLLDDVWGVDIYNLPRTVDVTVKRLRTKLGVAGKYLETVRGLGYRFTAEEDI